MPTRETATPRERRDTASTPIVELRSVRVDAGAFYDVGLDGLNLRIERGAFVLAQIAAGEAYTPLADVIVGITLPESGDARFMGDSWGEMPPAHAARQRGRIGRVFPGGGWLSALDMDENITLGPRHHEGRSARHAARDAARLVEQFGLAPLHGRRPVDLSRHELHVAQWVRAFFHEPELIILERPLHSVHRSAAGRLDAAIAQARERGAGILWIDYESTLSTIRAPDVTAPQLISRGDVNVTETSTDHDDSVQISLRP